MKTLLMTSPIIQSEDQNQIDAHDDRDNSRIPIGLYILATILIERQDEVCLENYALWTYSLTLDDIVEKRPDLVGISCYTANRHVVMSLCCDIKARLPHARIVLGGPHPTPLYEQILGFYEAVDYVAVGESERAFPDLVSRLKFGVSLEGIKGIAYRVDDRIIYNGPAPVIENLDDIPIPARYFKYHLVSTSRGCPGNCSFCASGAIWGRRVRYRSPRHVLDEIDLLINKQGVERIVFKDDTFTTRKNRLIQILQAMMERKYEIPWSCDTRVDFVTEEKLYWMKKAGCRRISYGVESGAEAILKEIGKQISVSRIKKTAALSRKFAIPMRFYLIVGKLGETNETLGQTLNLIKETRPTACFFSRLNIAPGTRICDALVKTGLLKPDVWVTHPSALIYPDLNPPVKSFPNYHRLINTYHASVIKGRIPAHEYTREERVKAVEYIGDTPEDNARLAMEFYEEEDYAEAANQYVRAIRQDANLRRAHVYLGHCHEKLFDDMAAETVWRQFLSSQKQPDALTRYVMLQLGKLYVRKKNISAAIAVLSRIIELDGFAFEAYTCLAEAYHLMNENADAIAVLKKSVSLNPDFPDTHDLLGKIYTACQEYELASNAFISALWIQEPGIDLMF